MLRAPWPLVALVVLGCGEETPPPTTSGAGGGGGSNGGCAIGDRLGESGDCCAPGTRPMAEGCVPAGVPPEACGQGFVADEAGGCEPILPADPCPDGMIALPGETRCRQLVDCGRAPWGDIAVEPNTEYVDASFAAAGDGSAAAPWTSIQEGIDAAEPGAIVAVAAGQYLEDLDVRKQVRVLGRCPEMVELVGQGSVGAIEITTEASTGAVIGRMAITGPGIGIVNFGGSDVALDRLWVHDTAGRGIDFEDNVGETDGSMQGSLVERAADASVIVLSASLTIVDSVIRDARAGGPQGLARGLVVKPNASLPLRSQVSVERSVIERVRNAGVLVENSDLEMAGSVIQDILPDASTQFVGRGIEALNDLTTGEAAVVSLRCSVLRRTHDAGIFVSGSRFALEGTVIRDIEPEAASGDFGTGIQVQPGQLGEPGQLSITASLIERAQVTSINVLASDATVDGVLVRDTRSGAVGSVEGYGIGLGAQDDIFTAQRASVVALSSIFERNVAVGVRSLGSDMTLEGALIVDTLASPIDQRLGHGLEVLDDEMTGQTSQVTATACAIERNRDTGILVHQSTATLENVVVRDTLPKEATGEHGMGIAVQRVSAFAAPPSLTLIDVLVENVTGVGVASLESILTAERVTILGVLPQPGDGLYGDGIAVVGQSAELRDCHIEGAARAGVASFAAAVVMSGSRLECNTIQLSGQRLLGIDYDFTDGGGNRCGCGDQTEACKVLASELAPPNAFE